MKLAQDDAVSLQEAFDRFRSKRLVSFTEEISELTINNQRLRRRRKAFILSKRPNNTDRTANMHDLAWLTRGSE